MLCMRGNVKKSNISAESNTILKNLVLQALGTIKFQFLQKKSKKKFHACVPLSVLKKVNLNVWQTCHNLFEISSVSVWFRSHHIFECFPLGCNRTSTMSHQTAPTPHSRQPSPSLYGSITFTYLEENSSMVKLPYLCEKARGNLYG